MLRFHRTVLLVAGLTLATLVSTMLCSTAEARPISPNDGVGTNPPTSEPLAAGPPVLTILLILVLIAVATAALILAARSRRRGRAGHSPSRAGSTRRRIGVAVSAASLAFVLWPGPASALDTSTAARPAPAPVRHWSNQGWLPNQRVCQIDGRDLAAGRAWKCTRSPARTGWLLWIDVPATSKAAVTAAAVTGSGAASVRPRWAAPAWQVRGWTPTHRMCEMDALTLEKVARWRCVPGPQRRGWVLQTQSSLR